MNGLQNGDIMNKTIAILGATGSVGTQAQDVARKRGYKVALMSAQRNVEVYSKSSTNVC